MAHWDEWRKTDEGREYVRKYNSTKGLTNVAHYRKTPKGNATNRKLWWKSRGIDLTVEQYDSLALAQKNVCAICGKSDTRMSGKLCVDHCHVSNKIRGLLCHFCNLAIGHFHDDVGLMEKAILYMKERS